jgi:type II secretory pathway pseudopilin PulG
VFWGKRLSAVPVVLHMISVKRTRIVRRSRVADATYVGKRARGFTLVEVMVAAMLLMFAMAGLVPFFLSALNQSTSVRYRSTATNIAREKMEEIRQLDYREIADAEFLVDRFGVAEIVRGVTYTVAYAVAESPYESGLLKEVTVTVGWTAPPKVSAASLTTMIHQQYVGPRISRMELHTPDPIEDPLHTPFDCLLKNHEHTLYAYVAEADWGLVIDKLNEAGMAVRSGTYMRLSLVDSKGAAVQLGSASSGYKITGLVYAQDPITHKVSEVYIPYVVNSASVPDGYWEFQAVMFNQYDEPGNLWRLRLRVENSGPVAPSSFAAIPQSGDQSVRLYWSGGGERDRAYYCIQRAKWDTGTSTWGSWENVKMDVGPDETNYLDQGNATSLPPLDPWGSSTTTNRYKYRIWAVDIGNNPGDVSETEVIIPPSVPATTTTLAPGVTTTTTVAGPTTTTTTVAKTYSVVIDNTINKVYDIRIDPGAPGLPDIITTVGKKTTKTVTGLAGGSYDIWASSSGRPTVHASFTLDTPDDDGMLALTIL